MTEISTIIIQYASMWAPALTAILGTVATIIFGIAKVNTAIQSLRSSRDNLVAEVKALKVDNEELIRVNKLLLDNITKINNYADTMKKGE